MSYSVQEYCDMYLLLGECHGSALGAARVYRQRYPTRRHPDPQVLRRLDRRLRATGSVLPLPNVDTGHVPSVRTPAVEDAVLALIHEDPTTSSRAIARQVNVHHSIVLSILHDEDLHPFHFTRVQGLLPQDYPRRQEYCEWLLQQHTSDNTFIHRILWTDEATFTREGVYNSHNSHVWALENPHATRPHAYQVRWGINVWCGIVSDRLVGPYLLPERLTAANYLVFLRDVLSDLLDDIPLDLLRRLWFQHDGAPVHYASIVRRWLDREYPDRWIGRGGPVPWPARSPDLNPVDFFLWGHLKALVYRRPLDSLEDLVASLHAAITTITPGMLQRVQRSIRRRAAACSSLGGAHVEHLL